MIDRRSFLASAAAGSGALWLAADPAVAARRVRRSQIPLALNGRFRQGVASGQPRTNAITLWTRLDEIERTSRLQVEVSRTADFRRVIHRQNVLADSKNGFTAQARVSGGALRAGEQYFYRFYTCNANSPVGRFRTALPADSLEPVRIGFYSCQDYESGFYTAHAGLAAEDDLDLVIFLGDYIYERSFDRNKTREDKLGANGDGEVQTLSEYREKYALYHSDANLRLLRQKHAMMGIWDDHEVEDNYARDKPGDATQHPRVPFLKRQANGYKAFFEHMPRVRVKSDPDRIFGKIPLGGNADVFLLDQRRFRDDQPCGDQVGLAGCPESDEPQRTMLGQAQKEWFKQGLANSRATWKVVGNQMMMMALDVPARKPLNPDQWDGYTAERRELMEFVQSRGIKDVTLLTGDIHTYFVGNVTPSGRQGSPTDGEPAATEFVGGSMTSKGVADSLGGEGGRDAAAFPSDQNVLLNNPHIRFSNQSFKGYGVLEARPNELRVDLRAARTVQARTSEIFTLRSFRVASGTPRVEDLGGPGPSPAPLPEVF